MGNFTFPLLDASGLIEKYKDLLILSNRSFLDSGPKTLEIIFLNFSLPQLYWLAMVESLNNEENNFPENNFGRLVGRDFLC